MTLTYEEARELFEYDPKTGVIKWLSNMHWGGTAGKLKRDGYVSISCRGKEYLAHRLAFLLMQRAWPPSFVDHVNGVRNDNRWENLRHASAMLNTQNLRGPTRANTSGFLGVSQMRGKWRATLTYENKQIWLGLHETAEEAYEAYLAGKRKYHEGCTI